MDNIKQELPVKDQPISSSSAAGKDEDVNTQIIENPKFQCSVCKLHETYDYFGMNPPYTKDYILLEDSYVIEDPFLPPKHGEFIILGANCVKCRKAVCKGQECSIYFDNTICLQCAKNSISSFPKILQDKLNKITT